MKALDPRIVAKVRVAAIHLTPNIKIEGVAPPPDPEAKPGDPAPVAPPPTWLQMATIDYELLDAAGNVLERRPLTHQHASGASKAATEDAALSVVGELAGWIRADCLALSNVDKEADAVVAAPKG